MALTLAPFTEQRLAQCDLRCGDRRAGLGICSEHDGCGAAASCPSFQAFRSWTRVRHLSYGRCETNNPQSRCLEGAGQVLSLLGVNRRTLICQYQRINWTRKALLFSHAGSLHGAAGSVRFTSACLTLQSNLALQGKSPRSRPCEMTGAARPTKGTPGLAGSISKVSSHDVTWCLL